jgi:RNA methyltransferase, TrmH family
VTPGDRPRAAAKPGEAPTQLTGRDNRWLKKFRAALRAGEPSADGSIGVEGPHLVEEALRAGLPIEAILASAAGERHLGKLVPLVPPGIPVLRTTDRLFAGVADTQTPQGIAALVCPRVASFDDLVRGRPLVVVLVGVQDPGNVGTILRAAEAFGATGVATCASGSLGTANPLSPKALRASAGSALRLPLVHCVAAGVLLAQLRVTAVKLYAASPAKHSSAKQEGRAVLNPWEVDLRGPSALLVGNEGAGLPLEVKNSADALVRIPLQSGVESLNAAVAASVLLYEAARQRGGSAPRLHADAPE